MKHLFSLAFTALALSSTLHSAAQGPAHIPGDLLIMVAGDASPEAIANDLRLQDGTDSGLRVVKQVSAPMRAWLLHFDPGTVPQPVMLRALKRHPGVQLAQNNHVVRSREVPNDPQYDDQWHHTNIDSEAAWDIATGGVTATGDSIVVCIIENADLPHADLVANAWYNHLEVPDNNVDDDANGYVDDFRGWNPPAGNDEVYGGGHGTQVAGMIGATGDNGTGVAGANWDVKMMVVDYGGVQESEVIAAYTYPLVMRRMYNETGGDKGAFVVATNASWGIDGGQPDDAPLWCAIYDSLGAEGVLSCGATANNAVDVDEVGDLPTACSSDYMISVTATDVNDDRTFSAYGLTTIDVGAPGDDVFTTSLGGGYGSTSGTSFASPLTAGVIGLLYSAPCASMMSLVHGDPAAGALYIRQALFDGVEQVGNLEGQTVTGGRISAGNSMALLMNSCGTCPAPYNLGATATGLGTATLGWSSTAGNVFDVWYREVGTPAWTEMNGVSGTTLALTALETCAAYEFQVRVECDGEMSDFTVPFTWTSEGCCNAPINVASGFIGDDLANVTWTGVLAAGSYEVQYATQGSTDWTTLTGITDDFAALEPLEPCTGYQVRVRSLCGGEGSDWSATLLLNTTGCGACIDLEFCASEGGSTEDEWIERVVVGTIDNTSGNDSGYGDHTGMSTNLTIGQQHPITLTPGYSFFAYDEYFTVWMDLDLDGQFIGANELVFDAGEASEGAVTGNLLVPTGTPPGPVRMRVMMQYQEAAQNGCMPSMDFGEVEDYCVNLVGTTGMAERAQGTINVFPTPADRDIFFDLSGPLATGKLLITVLDASGREVALKAMENGRATLTTAWLADGSYVYRITNGEVEVARGRFVVAHL